jgi:hypothetical protein
MPRQPKLTQPRDIPAQLSIAYKTLTELLLLRWAENPKDHDLGLIHQSIAEHGFNDPVCIDGKSGMIVEGHGRLACLEQMKAEGKEPPARIGAGKNDWLVPVITGVDFPNIKKAKKYALQHNRTTEMGGYLDDKLLAALKEQQDGLEGIGWDAQDIDAMFENQKPPMDEPGFSAAGKIAGRFTFPENHREVVMNAMNDLTGKIDGFTYYL